LLFYKRAKCPNSGIEKAIVIHMSKALKIGQLGKLAILASLMPIVATVVQADTVTLDEVPGYNGAGGGEFTAYTTSVNFNGNYSPEALLNGGFQTFCIETGVEFTPGTTYNYTVGNVSQPLTGGGTGSGLALSAGAAWLYDAFGTGRLNQFVYSGFTGPNSQRMQEDNLVQAAIWAFQGGQTYNINPYPGYTIPSADPTSTSYNVYYAETIDALGGLANADSAYTGTSVQILQMWSNSDDTGAAQNQLVLVPDGGTTVALLGGSLVGLQSLRRKRVC
jgi:VPDSG-CTERM motif